jgi:hypothetical protein
MVSCVASWNTTTADRELRSLNKLRYRGTWWLPAQNTKRVPGTLLFSHEEGGTLSLDGSLGEMTAVMGELVMLQPKIILGISSKGELLTLYDCFENHRTGGSSGLVTSRFYVSRVFKGAHFTSPELIRFRSLSVHYSGLDEWINTSGFEILYQKEEEDVIVKYKRPAPIEIPVDENWKVVLDFSCTYPSLTRVQIEAVVKQKAYVTIRTAGERTLDEYLDFVYDIRDFLTLAAMDTVYPLDIHASTEINKKKMNESWYYPRVEMYFRQLEVPSSPSRFYDFSMLFSFHDIYDQIRNVIANWFATRESLRSVRDLYFGTLYNPEAYLQQKFLSLAQALESYHRTRMKALESPEDEHRKRIAGILDKTDQQDRSWLEEKLRWSNEVTFRTRLKDLLHDLSDVVPEIIGDPDKLANQVVDTRNYLTHYDPRLRDQAASVHELIEITERLKTVLHACLTVELGLGKSMVRFLFAKNWRYQQMGARFKRKQSGTR